VSPLKEVGRFGTVGLELVISLVVGYLGGRWLDRRFDAHGWLLWLGIIAGLYSGVRIFQRTAREMRRQIEQQDREEPWLAARADDEGRVDGEGRAGGGPVRSADDDATDAAKERGDDAPDEAKRGARDRWN